MSRNTWTEFWRKEETAFFKIMRMSTSVFARRLISRFQIGEKHQVLDYGCGPGFLVDALVKQRCKVYGADINVQFIQKCKELYPYGLFTVISEVPSKIENELIQAFQDKKFDFIIMLSVAQYFETQEACQKVITILSKFLKKGGSIIIADVITPSTSSFVDLFAVLKFSLVSGNVINLIRFISHLLFSDYRELSSKLKLQSYSDDGMERIALSANLTCNKVEGLTLHPSRVNYVLSS
jgi:Methylase involved in ubiquinone/menaquinone biosynthesis